MAENIINDSEFIETLDYLDGFRKADKRLVYVEFTASEILLILRDENNFWSGRIDKDTLGGDLLGDLHGYDENIFLEPVVTPERISTALKDVEAGNSSDIGDFAE